MIAGHSIGKYCRKNRGDDLSVATHVDKPGHTAGRVLREVRIDKCLFLIPLMGDICIKSRRIRGPEGGFQVTGPGGRSNCLWFRHARLFGYRDSLKRDSFMHGSLKRGSLKRDSFMHGSQQRISFLRARLKCNRK